MIGWKKICAIVLAIIYFVIVFEVLRHKSKIDAKSEDEGDDFSLTTLNFCSGEEPDNNKASNLSFNPWNQNDPFNDFISVMEPPCLNEIIENLTEHGEYYSFAFYPYQDRKIIVDRYFHHTVYSIYEYCFGFEDQNWVLKLCSDRHQVLWEIYIVATIAVTLVIAMTIFIYEYYVQLRDTYGKSLTMVLIAQLMMYLANSIPRLLHVDPMSSTFRIATLFYSFGGCFLSILWISVMIFHNFWRLKNFKTNIETDHYFMIYVIITTIISLITGIIVIAEFYEKIPLIVDYIYLAILITDFILILTSAVYLIKLAMERVSNEQNKFNQEKGWFLRNLFLFCILMPIWLMESKELRIRDAIFIVFEMSSILDITKLFSALNIFIVFVMRKDVKILIFQKYQAVLNNEV